MIARALPDDAAVRVALDELIALRMQAQGGSLLVRKQNTATRSGGHISRWRGRGVDFRESRLYQAGDDIRHMDWRVTARSGKPHTKLFEEEREQGLLLALDCNPGMRFGTRVRFKSVQAARAAALLAWIVANGGDRVGALGFGGGIDGEIKPAGGSRGVLRVLRAIRDWDSASAVEQSAPLSSALERMRRLLRPGMRLVLLTDGFSADANAWPLLGQLAARHEISIVLVRDALELAPPPPGRYALAAGGVRRVLDFANNDLRRDWLARFATARENVRSECARRGVRVVEIDTQSDLRRALAPLLTRVRNAAVVA